MNYKCKAKAHKVSEEFVGFNSKIYIKSETFAFLGTGIFSTFFFGREFNYEIEVMGKYLWHFLRGVLFVLGLIEKISWKVLEIRGILSEIWSISFSELFILTKIFTFAKLSLFRKIEVLSKFVRFLSIFSIFDDVKTRLYEILKSTHLPFS